MQCLEVHPGEVETSNIIAEAFVDIMSFEQPASQDTVR